MKVMESRKAKMKPDAARPSSLVRPMVPVRYCGGMSKPPTVSSVILRTSESDCPPMTLAEIMIWRWRLRRSMVIGPVASCSEATLARVTLPTLVDGT